MTEVEGGYLGIDLGGTWLRLLAAGPDGVRGELVRAPTPSSYDALLEHLRSLAANAGRGRPASVVCGLPGTSGLGRPRFVPALPWIEERPLRADLGALLEAPVRLGFDGHLTLLAESLEGAAAGHDSAVLVALGTGVGGAVMTDRRIWHGHHGSAGAFGWLDASGALADPVHGPFEQVASGRALDAMANELHPGERGPDLIEAARRGDEEALAVARSYAYRIGRGLAAIASIFDPEVVLVGGGLSAAMDVLGPPLSETVARYASPDGRSVSIRPTALGSDAGAIGALLSAMGSTMDGTMGDPKAGR